MTIPATVSPDERRLLALLLAQPTHEALALLEDLRAQAPWLEAGIAELRALPLEHWQAEHTRLFINGWPKTPCPPFESAYRQGQMGGTLSAEIAAFYRRVGLEAKTAPPDYLGTLLECAAWLAQQADGAEALRELETAHLGRWVPDFARDLRAQARLRLYADLGARLAAWYPDPPAHA